MMLFSVLCAICVGFVASESCNDVKTLSWSTKGGNILLNGDQFHLKGVNYFGFETEVFAPHGLWGSLSLDELLDTVQKHNFNAIRLPFSVEMVFRNPKAGSVNCGSNPSLCKLNALELYGRVIDACAERGILVMIDQHVLSQAGGITNLWYDNPEYSEARILESWDVMLEEFGRKWNVFAIDLKNEPHESASWGNNQPATDWNKAAERIIKHIGSKHAYFKGLFFVEGVQNNADTGKPDHGFNHFWGENLGGVHKHPIRTGSPSLDNRVIYSPHVYGPDVYMQDYFKASDFAKNMPHIWNLQFGFVEETSGHPIVIGEWGGHYDGGKDVEWADELARYLVDRCMADQFYWCLNPNSGDTGGILQDNWKDVRSDKLKLLQFVQPNPSRMSLKNGKVCFTPGKSANAKCDVGGRIPQPSTTTRRPTETTSKSTKAITKGTTTHRTTPRSTKATTEGTTTQRITPSTAKPSTTSGDHSGGAASFSIIVEEQGSWGADFHKVAIKVINHGSSNLCDIVVKGTVDKLQSKWSIEQSGDRWVFPSWLSVRAGGTNAGAGMIVQGGLPTFQPVSARNC